MAQTTTTTTTATTMAPNNPFIKQLAANDRQTRDRALSSLRTFLTRKTTFTTLDFLKLQKALFYTMWSQDKPRPQRQLALDISALPSLLHRKDDFLNFVQAFWVTMAREWSGVDALRMDKFLFLCRRMVFAGFGYLRVRGWEGGLVRGYLGVLMEGAPLEPRDLKVPNGLRHHVVDVWVDEIERVDVDGGEDGGNTPFEVLLMPLRELGQRTLSKSVRERVRDALDDERVRVWMGEEEEEEDDEVLSEVDDDDEELGDADEEEEEENDGEWGGFDD